MVKLFKYPINLLFLLLIVISIIFFLNFNKGIEFTDESYSLLISLYPNDMVGRVNNSGAISNILLQLVNFNLYYFRILGALILFLSAFALLDPYYRFQERILSQKNLNKNYLMFFLLLGSLNYYHNWVITPSYNLYNLVGILFFLNGIIRLTLFEEKDKKIELFIAICLTIFGGLITFICKPPTTFFLILVFIIWFLYFFDLKKIFLILPIAILLSLLTFLIYILFYFKSFEYFINDIILGIELKTLLDPRYSIFDNFLSTIKQVIFYVYKNLIEIFVFIFLLIISKAYFKKKFLNFAYIIIFLPLFFYNGLILSTIFLIIFYFLFDLHLTKIVKINKKEITFLFFQFILIFILYAYTVGTNTNVIVLLQTASLIIFLIIYNFILKMKFMNIFNFYKIILMSFILLFFTIKNLYYNFEKPRRYNDKIYNQVNEIKLPNFSGKIYVDEITYKFINDFNFVLKTNDWKNGNYLIDLTGRTPGLNIISGAKFVSHPWWASAYIGSQPLAEKIISLSNIDKIKNSWIITTNHKFNISPEILKNIGLSLDKNYKFLGKVKRNNKDYFIWKPNKI